MADDERLKVLEKEIHDTMEDYWQILVEIRSFIMEAQNPLKRFERLPTRPAVQEGSKENDGEREETGK